MTTQLLVRSLRRGRTRGSDSSRTWPTLRSNAAIWASSSTTAELRVLHYLPTNLSLAEIGGRLFVSRYTVKTHCASIYRKLNATSRSEAVEAARRFGLLETAAAGETT